LFAATVTKHPKINFVGRKYHRQKNKSEKIYENRVEPSFPYLSEFSQAGHKKMKRIWKSDARGSRLNAGGARLPLAARPL